MPVWICLTFTLALNYVRHRKDKSTLCSAGRKVIPAGAFLFGWAALSAWLIPHYCNREKFPTKGGSR